MKRLAAWLIAVLTVGAWGQNAPPMLLYDASGNPYPNGGGTALSFNPPPFTCYTIVAGSTVPCTFSGGGSGITALTQDVTASGTGSVAATVVGINDTLLSGLATGILKNTTGTGVPSIAAAGTDYVAPGGALGTPSSGVITNLTGTCSACTANGVTTASSANAVNFSANGAASTAPLLLSGSILTGGTGTTNFPNLLIQPSAASAVTTWNTAGTPIGVNAASGFTGSFIDFHVNGGNTVFNVNFQGVVSAANSISAGANVTANNGTISTGRYLTVSNCSSSASPAVCGTSTAGSVVVAASATTVVVNTTGVTANSQIFVQEDSSLGTKLSVTCNTTPATAPPTITARTATTSFTITTTSPTTNPRCFSYWILN